MLVTITLAKYIPVAFKYSALLLNMAPYVYCRDFICQISIKFRGPKFRIIAQIKYIIVNLCLSKKLK